MKILITYAALGAGHFKAAEGLYNYLKGARKNLDVEMVGILDKANVLFKFSCIRGYSFLVQYAPFLWQVLFWITYSKSSRRIVRLIISALNYINTKNYAQFLIEENFDFIISTHFFCSKISAYLKNKGKIHSKIITVITDFGVHPIWLNNGTDIYIVASDFTKKLLMEEGVEEDLINVSGIPLHSNFLKQYDKILLCNKLGLNKNKFIVLIVAGSFGIGPIEKIIELLYKEVQILVVCANNKRLFERLKIKNYPDVHVFGFIDNMPELMSVSNLIVTKPGGLTVSESLAKDLFPIFFTAFPGQEIENIKILSNYGIGLYSKNALYIRDAILDFKNHPDKLMAAKDAINKIKKPYATIEVCNVVR